MKHNVAILQYRLHHYRVALFEQLRLACQDRDIELHLVHGQATRREQSKKDEGTIAWAEQTDNKVWEVGTKDIIWQPLPKHLHNVDLLVIMQENRILSNYPILLRRRLGGPKVGYWGHGVNFQSETPTGLRECWKNMLLNQVDWWFAYTQRTVRVVKASGYPKQRITCLNNTIDTHEFKQDLFSITDESLAKERKRLNIAPHAKVAIFCGSLYPDKRLDFLMASADRIREQISHFHLLVVGDGPSMPFLREQATSRPWLHLLGVQTGIEKATYFRMADIMLNPGLVGLHIVDAFCAGLAMLTISNSKHSPEVAYLRDGINGFMTSDDIDEYTSIALDLFQYPEKLQHTRAEALTDSEFYTLDRMVANFVDGIECCLRMPKL